MTGSGRRPGLWQGPGPVKVLAVHAHPDDETLATGIALAHHVAAGDEVHVVTCTLGEEGEVIPPGLAHLEGTDDLAPYRHEELAAAMRSLGVRHHYLGGDPPPWRDSGMAGSAAAAHPHAFAAADVMEAAGLLAALMRRIRPDVVLSYDEHGGYHHPDHIQTHRVTCAAVAGMPASQRPLLYAVLTPLSWAREDRAWLARHVPKAGAVEAPGHGPLTVPAPNAPFAPSVVPDPVVSHAVVDPAAVTAQSAALRHHRTQVSVFDGFYALSNDIAARLPGREGYSLLDPTTGRLLHGH